MSSSNRSRPRLNSFNHKSSVLCPETRHITSQYLALEQLEAHYRMVSNAKGVVDTSAPKSLQSYISNLNRKKKQLWKQTIPIPSTYDKLEELSNYTSQKRNNFIQNDHDFLAENADNRSLSLNKSIQAGFPMPSYDSKVADKISWYLEAIAQGEFHHSHQKSHRSSGMPGQFSGSEASLSSSMRSGKIVKGDLLDWHKKCFTSEKRFFSPRILVKNSSQSKLLDMRCYNHPRNHKKANSLNSSDTFESDDDEESSNSSAYPNESDIVEGRKNEERVDPTTENGSSGHKDEYEECFSEKSSRVQTKLKYKMRTDRKSSVLNQTHHNHFTQRMAQIRSPEHSVTCCNEDENCLQFLCDVTEDILRSGVYTDKAIQRTFEFHLQFYPKDSDETHLRSLLEQMIKKLKVDCDDLDEPAANFFFSNENTLNYPVPGNTKDQENFDGNDRGTVKSETSEIPEKTFTQTDESDKIFRSKEESSEVNYENS